GASVAVEIARGEHSPIPGPVRLRRDDLRVQVHADLTHGRFDDDVHASIAIQVCRDEPAANWHRLRLKTPSSVIPEDRRFFGEDRWGIGLDDLAGNQVWRDVRVQVGRYYVIRSEERRLWE